MISQRILRSLASSLLAGLLLIPTGIPAAAQNARTGNYAEVMQQSTQALRNYSWRMTTVISHKGEKKSMRIMRVHIAENGEQVRELVEEKRLAPMPGGIKGMIMRQKQEELSGKMPELIAGIKNYLVPDVEHFGARLQESRHRVYTNSEEGIVLHDFLHEGDQVTYRMGAKSLPAQVTFTSQIAGERVHVTARFSELEAGIPYIRNMTIELTDEGIRIESTNSGYQTIR